MLHITTRNNPAVRTIEAENNTTCRNSTFLIGSAALAAPAVQASLGLAAKGYWCPMGWYTAASALTAVFGIIWLSRAHAARRLKTALDVYADQEIARARHWKKMARAQRSKVEK
jgi:hypothetical protein